MRSGSAHCQVCLSGTRIGSPLVEHPDVLIAMNEISLRKFAPQVVPGGLVLYNRDALPADFALPHARVHCVPASEIADQLGMAKAANMAMLGALLQLTDTLHADTALAALESSVQNASLLDVDRRALQAGLSFAR
jgi:Pyruvate/2-oxoacid:ferredoxin oxidoreductase gamma subunit